MSIDGDEEEDGDMAVTQMHPFCCHVRGCKSRFRTTALD